MTEECIFDSVYYHGNCGLKFFYMALWYDWRAPSTLNCAKNCIFATMTK